MLKRFVTIPKGTLTSKYLQLFMAFATSAAIHQLGALNCPQSSSSNNWAQALFFLIQPLAITCEDLALFLGKKAEIKRSCKSSPATERFCVGMLTE